MRYFKHDLNAFDDDKVWELVDLQGMQGYGVWWWILEQLYSAEESGFQIHASETWFKRSSKAMNLTDWRTLVRILDTMSEVGLIDSQLWAEHYIYCPGIIKRADAYVSEKVAAKERKRRQRERAKALKEQESHAGVTRDVTEKAESHTTVLTRQDPDPDPDPDPEESRSMSPEGGQEKSTGTKEVKNSAFYLKGCAADHRQKFEEWWKWYKARCNDLNSSPGSKASAAKEWAVMEKSFDLEEFRRGCQLWFKEAQEKNNYAPHGYIFLKGKDTHVEPYWIAALDNASEASSGSEFMGEGVEAGSHPDLSDGQLEKLRALHAQGEHLSGEEMMLITPGFKINNPNWGNVRFLAEARA